MEIQTNKTMEKRPKEILFTVLNGALLLINVILGAYNIRSNKVNMENARMQVADRLPQFEISYFEIWKEAFEDLEMTGSMDSLYTDALKNFQVAKSDALKINYDQRSDYETVTCLAIKQIGGSLAKNVTIEFDCLNSKDGLDYFVTTSADVFALDDMNEDVSGNRISKKPIKIQYGDIQSGRGLIIPLFEVSNLRNKEDYNPEEAEVEVWSLTGPVILVPKVLKYKNIYNNKSSSLEIREMNNSYVTYSLYVQGRG